MTSALTQERPEIWAEGLRLAQVLTGWDYPSKRPLSDGTVYACGGGDSVVYPPTKTPAFIRFPEEGEEGTDDVDEHERHHRLKIKRKAVVPEGAMEWLLHEAGHWLVATPEERLRPNYGLTLREYGLDGEREWQAWAFEEIVLAPFGPSRHFAPPTQRDGAAFAKMGPIPAWALRHAEERIREQRVDVEQWRAVWGQWIGWGGARGRGAPWMAVA